MKVHANKVRVTLGQAARGRVWINGQEVPNIARVVVTGAAGEASSVVLDLTAVEVELDVTDELPEEGCHSGFMRAARNES